MDTDWSIACRERDALAIQLAYEWGWPPEPDAILTRLRGDRTAALITFHEEAMWRYLGVLEVPYES